MNQPRIIAEILLYLILLCLLCTGVVDGLALSLPLGAVISLLPGFSLIGLAILMAAIKKRPSILPRMAYGSALVALTAVFIAQSPMLLNTESGIQPGHSLYLATMILAAFNRRLSHVILCWSILFTGECGHRLFHVLSRLNHLSLEVPFSLGLTTCSDAMPILALSFLVGLLTHLILQLIPAQPIQALLTPSQPPQPKSEVPAMLPLLHAPPRSETSIEGHTQSVATLKPSADQSDFADLLSSVVFFMSRNFQAFSALGFIYDPVKHSFILSSSQSRSTAIRKNVVIAPGSGLIGKIATEKHSFMSGDFTLYNQDLQYYSSPEMINSVLAVPIISDQHELLGVLVLDSRDKNAFTDQHKETLKRFSGLAAALITSHRIRYFQERTAKQFQTFYQASQSFTTTMKADDVYDVLLQMADQCTHSTRMMIIIFNPNRRVGIIHTIRGFSGDLQTGMEFPINNGLYSYAFQKRALVNIPDMRQHQQEYFRFVPTETPNPAIGSLLIIPVIDEQSRCFCLLSIESDRDAQFSSDIEPILCTLTGNASVALNRAFLYEKMELLATTDGLTGLSNHRNFQDSLMVELERSRRYGQPISLMLMDIDHFKSFNDTHGHTVGDLVLKDVAQVIKHSIRRTDFPARYGGEEFVVIMPATDPHNAQITAERVRQNVESHLIKSMEKTLRVTVSIGFDTYFGDGRTQTEFINNADTAMYVSKESGRNRTTQWTSGMKGKGHSA